MVSDRQYVPLESVADLNLRAILYRLVDSIAQLRASLDTLQASVATDEATIAALSTKVASLDTALNGILYSGFQDFGEIGDPQAPGRDTGRLYARDNGLGKSQLVARFNTGAIQVIVTEP